MLRLIVMALRSFFFLIYEINKCNYMMKRPEKYSELDKYREVQKIVDKMRKIPGPPQRFMERKICRKQAIM